MKTLKLLFVALLATFLFSCEENNQNSPINGEPMEIGATLQIVEPSSRTSLDGIDVHWSSGDQIQLFAGTTGGTTFTAVQNTGDAKTYARFTGIAQSSTFTHAIYPAQGATSNSVTLPTQQTYVEGTIADNTMPMWGQYDEDNIDNELSFKNLSGIIKLQLIGNKSVSSIVLTSSEFISGQATIDATDPNKPSLSGMNSKTVTLNCETPVQLDETTATAFHLVAAPVSTNVFTITVNYSDNTSATRTTTPYDGNIITRNKIILMPQLNFDGVDIEYASGEYYIYTAKGMKAFADLVNGDGNTGNALTLGEESAFNFTSKSNCITGNLTTDVNMDYLSSWTPIGSNSNPFGGIFNGNDHTISDLHIPNTTDAGLFGYISESCINDLTVDIASATTTSDNVAAIVGNLESGILQNCHSTGEKISGNSYIAGIAGKCFGGELYDCTNTCDIDIVVEGGGIIGGVRGATTVVHCYNYGDIYAETQNRNTHAGGVVGTIYDAPSTYVLACANFGDVGVKVNSTNIAVGGGVVGWIGNNYVEIVACYNTGAISSEETIGNYYHLGGIVADKYNTCTNVNITSCYSSGTITAEQTSELGGIVGDQGNQPINIVESYYYNFTGPQVGDVDGITTGQKDGVDGVILQLESMNNTIGSWNSLNIVVCPYGFTLENDAIVHTELAISPGEILPS